MTIQPFAAIILAAGKGTRMRSDLPKVLHKIAGFPMLSLVLRSVQSLSAEKIIIVSAADMPQVQECAKNHAPQAEIVIQKQQLGTADAVKAAKDILGDYAGTILVLYGDTPLITNATIKLLLQKLEKNDVAVLGMRNNVANEYGRLITEGEKLIEIVEYKNASLEIRNINLCNSGVMAVRANIFALLEQVKLNSSGEYYLTDLVEIANKQGLNCSFQEASAEELAGVNSREELSIAEASLQRQYRKNFMQQGVTLLDPASVYFSADTKIAADVIIQPHVYFGTGVEIEAGAEIRAFSHIEGAKIGKNAVVGPFARLRLGTVLEENVGIGNFVEVKNATFKEGAKASHLSYLGDATIGKHANIGAGTITCNYDGVKKSHTEIGDNAFIGSNTALVAPVNIGAGALVGAGSTITRDVEAGSLALTRSEQKEIEGWRIGN